MLKTLNGYYRLRGVLTAKCKYMKFDNDSTLIDCPELAVYSSDILDKDYRYGGFMTQSAECEIRGIQLPVHLVDHYHSQITFQYEGSDVFPTIVKVG